MKKKELSAVKTKVKVELMFHVELSVSDADDMAEISRETVRKFREGIMDHSTSISKAIVKTEIV